MARKGASVTAGEKLLAEQWFDSEKEIAAWILAGKVYIGGQQIKSYGQRVPKDAQVSIREYYKRKYVGKGGLKLEAALAFFGISAEGVAALDCGASTGGFTDCLLLHGAQRVYAVDAGAGQLAAKLRSHPCVVNLEGVNLADPRLLTLSPRPTLITLDLSYLSLRKAIPLCHPLLADEGQVIALVKPLFEIERMEARRSGEEPDEREFLAMLLSLCDAIPSMGFGVLNAMASPIRGNKGTHEFLLHLKKGAGSAPGIQSTLQAAAAASQDIPEFSRWDS